MTHNVDNNNCIIPENIFNNSLDTQSNYKFGVKKSDNNTLDAQYQQTNDVIKQHINDNHNIEAFKLNFFSSSEAVLCSQIIKAIQKNHQTLFIPLPQYAQDNELAKRIADYINVPNTKSVVINADGLGAAQIISEYIKQLSLDGGDNIYHEFAHLMTDYFRHGFVLHSVIYNAQSLTKQDFDYLYELASLIYEKFPKQRDKSLMRFVFIGDKTIASILRKKTNSKLLQFTVQSLTVTECVNALYLYTPSEQRTELFYQTVGTNATGLQIATAGYPVLLRRLLPMPDAPSLADKQNPEHYLSKIIDDKIDAQYHNELEYKRFIIKRGYHFIRPRTYIRLLLGIIATILLAYIYHLLM